MDAVFRSLSGLRFPLSAFEMTGLSWWQARDIARSGRAVRRAAWAAGRWMTHRANIVWQRTGSAPAAPVAAADVEPAHFTERDWTDEGPPAEPPYVTELFIQSLGVQDDDLRVTVGGTVVSDTRWNQGWYNADGEHPREYPAGVFPPTIPPWPTITAASWRKIRVTDAQAAALGLRMVAGMEVEVDVFDGWASDWRTSPWRATVTWSDGLVETCDGGWASSGSSATPPTPSTYFEINLYALFRTPYGAKDLPAGATFGVQTFGPYPYAAKISSHASNPAGADDTLLINGTMIDDLGYAHTLFGGATTDILTLPAGDTFTADIYNYASWCHGWGALRVEPLYYSTPPAFAEYHPNGSFVL